MLLECDASLLGCACLLAVVISYTWNRFCSLRGLPSTIPWAGATVQNPLGRAKSTRRSLLGLKSLIEDGYNRYSKQGRAFVLPNLVTGPEVIIPMAQLPWLLSQPDTVLSQHEVNKEFLRADYTMLHPHISRDYVHARVIREEMTKGLDTYSSDVTDEIMHALTLNWGSDLIEWKEIPVYETMLDVISRISNRVLVGKTLCRDAEYLLCSRNFARHVVFTAGLINLLPPFLRPFFSPFILAYDYFQYYCISRMVLPLVKKRAKGSQPGLDYKQSQHSRENDYIAWALRDAYSRDDLLDRTPEMITKRLSVLSFAAIQSSVITITNCLFDMASSDNCLHIQQLLKNEVDSVMAGGPERSWDRRTLASLHSIDSALRESMRLWGFISRGVMKKVMVPQGISLPSGEHIPYGAKVGVTSYAVHHDEDVYPQAMKYDTLRFARNGGGADDDKPSAASHQTIVTSSDTFMAFSHGRHACPGRFFAANQLKLLLAAIVAKYEIEPIAERPENPWLNNTIGPPMWSKLRVRRRAEPVAL